MICCAKIVTCSSLPEHMTVVLHPAGDPVIPTQRAFGSTYVSPSAKMYCALQDQSRHWPKE
jgi:hypothetical protein